MLIVLLLVVAAVPTCAQSGRRLDARTTLAVLSERNSDASTLSLSGETRLAGHLEIDGEDLVGVSGSCGLNEGPFTEDIVLCSRQRALLQCLTLKCGAPRHNAAQDTAAHRRTTPTIYCTFTQHQKQCRLQSSLSTAPASPVQRLR